MNVVGHLSSPTGLGVAASGVLAALKQEGIPYAAVDVDERSSRYVLQSQDASAPDPLYRYTLICTRPDRSDSARRRLPEGALADTYVIANWYWETELVPRWWHRDIRLVDELWAPSHFLREAYERSTETPVHHMPPVVTKLSVPAVHRSKFGLPAGQFLFLTMASGESGLRRKNPIGTMEAYCRAFSATESATALVVKLNGPHSSLETELILRRASLRDDVIVLEQSMTDADAASLIGCCDCFVSLHRSEGFGLGPAEAMALGRPTILTGWSGNVDYMTDENCLAVPYSLVSESDPVPPYGRGFRWADPDLDAAAAFMQRVVADAALARSIGDAGRATIIEAHSPASVGKRIRERLSEIDTQAIGDSRRR